MMTIARMDWLPHQVFVISCMALVMLLEVPLVLLVAWAIT
jgi:hypothetical protein